MGSSINSELVLYNLTQSPTGVYTPASWSSPLSIKTHILPTPAQMCLQSRTHPQGSARLMIKVYNIVGLKV